MSLTIRLTTGAGRTRLSIDKDANLQQLKEKIEEQTKIPWTSQELTFEGSKPVPAQHGKKLSELGFENGQMLFLQNSKNAEITAQVLNNKNTLASSASLSIKNGAVTTKKVEEGGSSSSTADPTKADDPTKSGDPTKSAAPKKPESTGILMNGKIMEAQDKKEEPTHVSFEKFLRARSYNVGGLPGMQSYVPFKLVKGKQNKMPPPISLNMQKFRHVDHLEFMNTDEMESFVGYWKGQDYMVQRGGYMYGYYKEDKHYEYGVRAVLEGIYEPPQTKSESFVQFSNLSSSNPQQLKSVRDGKIEASDIELNDKRILIVDQIAERLGLDRIGWVYTGLPNDELLNSAEVIEIAKMQHLHSTKDHYSKYELSTFLAATIRPDFANGGQPDVKVFMVSDQCQAMVRDDVLDNNNTDDPKHLRIAKPKSPDMMMPAVLQSGKDAGIFDPDWCVVRINDGAPLRRRSMFPKSNYKKWPASNRGSRPSRSDLRAYFQANKNASRSWARFADFHLLIYLADEFDLETVLTICDAVRDRSEVPDGVIAMVEGYC